MKKKKAYNLLIFLLLQAIFTADLFADTIPIPEILIQTTRENFFSTSNYNYNIDKAQLKYDGLNSIGEVLNKFTPAQINTYGLGGISTISLRGTADDQTSIFWNGIKINSLTLGSTDISLIPINSAQQIAVVTNASSAVLGNGNFGGAVLLSSKPTFSKQINITIRQDIAAFRNYKTSFALMGGNKKIQFSTSSFYQNAKNNFPFYDKYKFDNPLVINNHNETMQWATVNELNIKLKKNQQLDLGNFTLGKHHNLPAMMGAYQSSDKFHNDFSVKSFAKYQKYFTKAQFYFRSGHVYDYMLYNDSLSKINAPYYSHQLQNSANFRYYFNNAISLDAGADYVMEYAKVAQYMGIKYRHRGALFSGIKYAFKGMELNAVVRQEIVKGKYIRPQLGITIAYTDKKQFFTTSFSYADKYRIPDFNDLYWQPGGNPHLLPENGFTIEYNFVLHPLKATAFYQPVLSATTYYSLINNNIIWTPIASGLYSPLNILKTKHYGVELKMEHIIQWNKSNLFKASINYNFNRALIVQNASNTNLNGHFIRYKPQHTIKSYFVFEDKNFNIGLNYLYVSSRFTDDENIKAFQLKPYSILDFFIAFKGSFKKFNAEISFKVNNVTNTQYESLRSYAQPLRNYVISIFLNYKSILK